MQESKIPYYSIYETNNNRTVRLTKQDVFHFSYSQQINDRGVSINKDFSRNFDQMGKNSPYVRAMLKNDFERPFNNAKSQYVDRLTTMLNSYHDMCEFYGIKKGSKESEATQWYDRRCNCRCAC